jgi:hypothetical protein
MRHEDKAKTDRVEQDRPNRDSNMEPAEGSRGNTNVERGQSELPPAAFGEAEQDRDNAGGISNRPLGEEQGRQENLPPRGERRENWQED